MKLFNSHSYFTSIYNSIAELVIPIEYQVKKTEIEIHPVIVEAKIRKCLI